MRVMINCFTLIIDYIELDFNKGNFHDGWFKMPLRMLTYHEIPNWQLLLIVYLVEVYIRALYVQIRVEPFEFSFRIDYYLSLSYLQPSLAMHLVSHKVQSRVIAEFLAPRVLWLRNVHIVKFLENASHVGKNEQRLLTLDVNLEFGDL